jgi:hypothetical protein
VPFVEKEIEFCMKKIEERQNNESAWAYMRSMLTHSEKEKNRLPITAFPALITWV